MSATTTTRVLCGNCKGYHPSAAAVKACYMGTDAETAEVFQSIANGTSAVVRNAESSTLAQHRFIQRLRTEKGEPACGDAFLHALSKAQASQEIDRLKAMADAPNAKPGKVAKGEQVPGTDLIRGNIHLIDGMYFRVHVAQSTGRPYACVYDQETGQFEYAPSFTKRLKVENQVTPEQAAAFGEMTGHCCFCNTAIDTPESVAVGYGPICAGKFGLPWG